MVCYFLQLIPIANILFSFTNAVGAALWSVAQWQEEQKLIAQYHAQHGTTANPIEASAEANVAQGASTNVEEGHTDATQFGLIDVLAVQEEAMEAKAAERGL
jgi:hypothetical protein